MLNRKNSRPMRWVALGLLVSALGGAGVVALASAPDQGEGPDGGRPEMHGMGRMQPPPPPFPLAGPGLDHLLRAIDATPAQTEQLRKISQTATAEMDKQREAVREDQRAWMQAFTQPTVDAKAIEALRQKSLARHDAMTLSMSQAMLEASKVLTAEQRQKLAELMARHAEHADRRDGEGRPHHDRPAPPARNS